MATKQTEKLLNWTTVKKEAKKYDKQEKYTLHDDTTLKFYPYFPETKIDELMTELQVLLKDAEEKELKLNNESAIALVNLLIIKHMTHLKRYINGDFLAHQEAMEILKNGKYFTEIMQDVFIQEEIFKVYDRISQILGQNQAIENMMSNAIEYAKQIELKNKDVFKQFGELKKQKQVQ